MGVEKGDEQEARCKRLWETLDAEKEGRLDLDGLKHGLHKLDHPLKNADPLLKDVLHRVDANGDGHIEYHEFRDFIGHAEKELRRLFESIDRNHNGQLDKEELRVAFEDANVHLTPARLDNFFARIDTKHDGVITFDEWRKFLIFVPEDHPSLRTVLSYYSSAVSVNSEGDVQVSGQSGEGLGIAAFFTSFFGGIAPLLQRPPPKISHVTASSTGPLSPPGPPPWQPPQEIKEQTFPWDPGEDGGDTGLQADLASLDDDDDTFLVEDEESQGTFERSALLTGVLPNSGYFLAGGIAGAVSRTATAPLDRLKVYLIAQTTVRKDVLREAKKGNSAQAAKVAARPLVHAMKHLWRLGGMRSLFAGNGLNVVKVMPESAIKFGSYEGSKRAFARLQGLGEPKELGAWSQFFAAGLGGIISQFCIYPLDTLKFRMQCETVEGGPRGNALIIATAKKMLKAGPRSFYRGLPMGLVGMFPYSAIDLTTFEYVKRTVTARNAKRLGVSAENPAAAPGNFTTATMGALSGAIGASAVYPLNLLRTRLQSQGTAIHPPTYTGIWDVTVRTVRGEGVRGLFKGITPNLLKVVPAVSITYVVYDNSKAVLGLR